MDDAEETEDDARVADESAAVDAYIAALPLGAQHDIEAVRVRIRAVVPDASETLSYGIPTYRLGGRYLIYVAAWKRHLSLYPVPHGDAPLQEALAPYRAGRGTLRFAYGAPIADGLVERVVAALIEERNAA